MTIKFEASVRLSEDFDLLGRSSREAGVTGESVGGKNTWAVLVSSGLTNVGLSLVL
jgi:hypothetical protein